MKLSTKGRYAVIAMIDIAIHGQGSCVSIGSISKRNNISIPYLEQLFIKLKKNNLVTSIKGSMGGYILSENPKNITILDIVIAVDEKIDIVKCDAVNGCSNLLEGNFCSSHDLWHNLMMMIYSYLKGISLEDVIFKNINVGKVNVSKGNNLKIK